VAVDPTRIEGLEELFAAGSQRVIRAAMAAQIEEAEHLGLGDIPWVSQLRACVGRLDAALASFAPDQPPGRAALHLRLVPPPA